VVDDDSSLRRVMKMELEEAGYLDCTKSFEGTMLTTASMPCGLAHPYP